MLTTSLHVFWVLKWLMLAFSSRFHSEKYHWYCEWKIVFRKSMKFFSRLETSWKTNARLQSKFGRGGKLPNDLRAEGEPSLMIMDRQSQNLRSEDRRSTNQRSSGPFSQWHAGSIIVIGALSDLHSASWKISHPHRNPFSRVWWCVINPCLNLLKDLDLSIYLSRNAERSDHVKIAEGGFLFFGPEIDDAETVFFIINRSLSLPRFFSFSLTLSLSLYPTLHLFFFSFIRFYIFLSLQTSYIRWDLRISCSFQNAVLTYAIYQQRRIPSW